MKAGIEEPSFEKCVSCRVFWEEDVSCRCEIRKTWGSLSWQYSNAQTSSVDACHWIRIRTSFVVVVVVLLPQPVCLRLFSMTSIFPALQGTGLLQKLCLHALFPIPNYHRNPTTKNISSLLSLSCDTSIAPSKSEFSSKCDLVLPLSNSSVFSFHQGRQIAAYVFFLVF